jgi:hypothetical protein
VLDKRADRTSLTALPIDPLRRVHFLAERTPGGRFDAEPAEPSGVRSFYLRLPGLDLADGDVAQVHFRRGALVPKLDRRYELMLADVPFALTARNGLHGRDGAHYVIEVGGERYEYLLPGRGFQHEVLFGGDIDRDGKPDFVIFVADDDGGAYYLLLSSQAQPGMNPPAALLALVSCSVSSEDKGADAIGRQARREDETIAPAKVSAEQRSMAADCAANYRVNLLNRTPRRVLNVTSRRLIRHRLVLGEYSRQPMLRGVRST